MDYARLGGKRDFLMLDLFWPARNYHGPYPHPPLEKGLRKNAGVSSGVIKRSTSIIANVDV